jgi:predicted TIM-barrel fold metal-dependent hydrolase
VKAGDEMTIDVHGHITSPLLFERFPMPRSLMDIDGMIEKKAGLGISLTIVGSPVGAGTMVRVPGLDNNRQSADQLSQFHDWLAGEVRARPGQLKAYAYVNPFGGDKALATAADLLEQDEFVGLIANSSVAGEFLDSPRADDFFAMAASRRAPILLHPPAEPAGSQQLRDPRLVEHVARPCDIATGVAAIVFAGWLEKYPELVIIAPTAGGALPLLAEKLQLAARMPRKLGPAPVPDDEPVMAGPLEESLARIYVDTATPNAAAVAAALEVLGPRNVLVGTDTPPLSESLEQALSRLDGLVSAEDQALIKRGNASRIFGIDGSGPAGRVPDPKTQGESQGEETR